VVAIVAVVSSLNAQTRVMTLDGRGSQLGVMVSDGAGVVVDEVNAGSPAEKAGIKAGDVVVEFDGERVRSARQLTRLIQETPEGRAVAIGLLRDGKKQTVNATPENTAMTFNYGPDVDRVMRDAERGAREFRFDTPGTFDFRLDGPDRDNREPRRFEYRLPWGMMPFMAGSRGRLGVSVQSLTPDLEEYFGAKNGGALVSSVTKESAAAKAGVKAGDVITSINGKRVNDADDLVSELDDVTGAVTIVVMRDKKELTLKATIEEPKASSPQGPQTIRPRAGSRPGMI
jgi:S1-C subfamily serine protease